MTMLAALVAKVPTGSDPKHEVQYMNYLYRNFSSGINHSPWKLDIGKFPVEFGWWFFLVLLFFGVASIVYTKRSSRDERVYPIARYNELTERDGRISHLDLIVWLAILGAAMYYVVKTIEAGYIYHRF